MYSIRGRVYIKALGVMFGYDLNKSREMIKSNLSTVEKDLGLWPYINQVRKLVNKYVIKEDIIKEEDLKNSLHRPNKQSGLLSPRFVPAGLHNVSHSFHDDRPVD